MTERTRAVLATTAACAVGAVAVASGVFILWLNRSVLYGNDVFLWGLFTATAIAFTIAGWAILRRSSIYVIGWLCLLTGGALELSLLLSHYGIYTLVVAPGALPAPGVALVLAEPLPWVYLGALILIALLFPTGRLVSPRWRWTIVATIGAVVASASTILQPHEITDIWSDELSHAGARAMNPFGVLALAHVTETVIEPAGGVLLAVSAIAAVVSLFVRRRRASLEERKQIRWLAFVAGAALVWIVLFIPIMAFTSAGADGEDTPAAMVFWLVITPLVALGPPIAIGIGIVKYRLFDIDIVIRKTVVVAVVAFALTVVYVAVLALATLAPLSRAVVGVILVAVTFAPVLRAARAIGNRAAYGRRATHYEVLSAFSERIAETYAADDVLPRMAAVLAEGTGAASAGVWLRVGSQLRCAATTGGAPGHTVELRGGDLPGLGDEATEIRHGGELLGALSVSMPPNDPLDPARRALMADMASQAGLVLRNVRLIEELRASRQRLVAAQDEERRKIERNLHDGVQQQLVALNVQLGLLAKVADREPAKAGEMASGLQTRATEALEDLRDLARGIYPPLLADKGLAAALEAQARKAATPTTVEADGLGRYDRAVESAVYFCTLEALNNTAKYANASHATVALAHVDEALTFSITDDGDGFDPSVTSHGTGLQGMADRLDAIGGALTVTSEPGRGTTVTGSVPI